MAMSKSNSTYKEILRRIHHGIYSPGEKLPGEIPLAGELGVSRVTLRSALKQLVSEGIVEQYLSSLLRQNLADAGH